MATDPPAPDLGALRERLDRRLENYQQAGQNWGRLVSRAELEALLAHIDAQAARLAAARPMSEALQQVCYALSVRYNYRGDADVGYAVVREQYGARVGNAYRAARAALAVSTAGAGKVTDGD